MSGYHLLLYEVASDYLERRPRFREPHLTHARAAHQRGELLLAGACGDPIDGAALVFVGGDPRVAEHFARTDPYVREGLVTGWKVRPWHVVVGGDRVEPR